MEAPDWRLTDGWETPICRIAANALENVQGIIDDDGLAERVPEAEDGSGQVLSAGALAQKGADAIARCEDLHVVVEVGLGRHTPGCHSVTVTLVKWTTYDNRFYHLVIPLFCFCFVILQTTLE